MTFTRRTIVRLAATAVAAPLLPGCAPTKGDDTAAATPTRSAEPAPWAAPGDEDAVAFTTGVQVGDATPESAIVAIRTAETALTVVVMEADGDAWVELDRVPVTAADGGAVVTLEGLAPDTAYALAVYADETRRTGVTRLRTAPTAGRIVQFGATSCLGDASPSFPSLGYVAQDALDFFLLLGDTVYADGASTLEAYRAYWNTVLAVPSVRSAFSSTSLVATWDDHELANNWSWDGMPQDRYDAALAAYRESLPQRPGPTGGIWRKLAWGPTLDLFVLDCRSERLDGHYISPEQMQWLEDELSASTARFKVILNSVPITNLTPMFASAELTDRWDGYPEDRARILQYLHDHAIPGVLWVTGDVHFASVAHVDAAGGVAESAWEVFVGPAGSPPNVLVDLFEENDQYTWLSSAWNWTRFTCEPGAGTILVEHVGEDGGVLNAVTLTL
jgi:alkaline phosphatase D